MESLPELAMKAHNDKAHTSSHLLKPIVSKGIRCRGATSDKSTCPLASLLAM